MKALSIRAPWWWFILHAGKDIENRDWPTRYRGPVLIHASKWWRQLDVTEDFILARRLAGAAMPAVSDVAVAGIASNAHGGHLVGRVDIVDCVQQSQSPWFFGQFGFVLANPVAFKTPIPCKGALGLFDIPADIRAAVDAANA